MIAKPGKKLQRCPNCGHAPLRDATITDRFPYETGEEAPVTVEVSDVPVQVCDQCGEHYLGPEAVKAQHMAVCRALGLLTPDQIKAIRERFGPTQAEFARLTGIGEATISRWERGRMLPNRAMDRYLRLLSARPEESRTLLRELACGVSHGCGHEEDAEGVQGPLQGRTSEPLGGVGRVEGPVGGRRPDVKARPARRIIVDEDRAVGEH